MQLHLVNVSNLALKTLNDLARKRLVLRTQIACKRCSNHLQSLFSDSQACLFQTLFQTLNQTFETPFQSLGTLAKTLEVDLRPKRSLKSRESPDCLPESGLESGDSA